MSYTPEQVRRIVQGLATGKPRHRPMTDKEFLRSYDPTAYRDERLTNALERLTEAIEGMAAPSEAPTTTRPTKPAFKGVPLG